MRKDRAGILASPVFSSEIPETSTKEGPRINTSKTMSEQGLNVLKIEYKGGKEKESQVKWTI